MSSIVSSWLLPYLLYLLCSTDACLAASAAPLVGFGVIYIASGILISTLLRSFLVIGHFTSLFPVTESGFWTFIGYSFFFVFFSSTFVNATSSYCAPPSVQIASLRVVGVRSSRFLCSRPPEFLIETSLLFYLRPHNCLHSLEDSRVQNSHASKPRNLPQFILDPSPCLPPRSLLL